MVKKTPVDRHAIGAVLPLQCAEVNPIPDWHFHSRERTRPITVNYGNYIDYDLLGIKCVLVVCLVCIPDYENIRQLLVAGRSEML